MASAAGNGAGVTAGVVMGGFLCLGLVLLGIAGTIILSLISIYTPNRSVEGYGDQYQINPMMLKTLYTNTSNNFNNSTIATNTALNTLFTNTIIGNGEQNVAGAVVDQHFGFGPTNDDSINQKRRRRAYGYSGLYSIARGRIFYSTTCGELSDKGKYSNNVTSNCVKARLTACNSLFNNSAASANFFEWTPVSSLTYSIVNNPTVSYVVLSIFRVFGVRFSRATTMAANLTITGYNFAAGCQYIGPISHADIATIIATQSTVTTTQPTSTQYTG